MELYREHNVNPFASCLPLLFQVPIFIGLYQTLHKLPIRLRATARSCSSTTSSSS